MAGTPNDEDTPVRAAEQHRGGAGVGSVEPSRAGRPRATPQSERKQLLLRLDPRVHEALTRWAGDEFRSVNAQIELVLRRALDEVGRMPRDAGPLPRRGRPPKQE